MKTLFYILSLALVVASCKKDKPLENESITISGKIVQNCGMTPLANSPMKLLVSVSQAFTGSDVTIYDFTSDANGNFTFTLTNPPTAFTTQLRFGGTIIKGVVGNSSKDLGTLIASPTANFVVKLKVNNPYSLGDTLAIADFRDMSEMHISAPFKDTTLPVIYNYSSLNNRNLTNKNDILLNSNSFVFKGAVGTSSFNVIKSMRIERTIPACTGMVDTVLIEIN